MAFETDSSKITRSEAFDQIFNRIIKSQKPDVGKSYDTMQVVVLVLSICAALTIMFLVSMNGFMKGNNEDDGFWEFYDLWRRTAVIMTLMLTAIMVLSIPFTYEIVFIMLDTMSDIDFFKNTLPKLEGCIDEYNIKEVIAVSQEKVFDGLILTYIQVGCSGGAVFFCLCNLMAACMRKCVDNSTIEREYN